MQGFHTSPSFERPWRHACPGRQSPNSQQQGEHPRTILRSIILHPTVAITTIIIAYAAMSSGRNRLARETKQAGTVVPIASTQHQHHHHRHRRVCCDDFMPNSCAPPSTGRAPSSSPPLSPSPSRLPSSPLSRRLDAEIFRPLRLLVYALAPGAAWPRRGGGQSRLRGKPIGPPKKLASKVYCAVRCRVWRGHQVGKKKTGKCKDTMSISMSRANAKYSSISRDAKGKKVD